MHFIDVLMTLLFTRDPSHSHSDASPDTDHKSNGKTQDETTAEERSLLHDTGGMLLHFLSFELLM